MEFSLLRLTAVLRLYSLKLVANGTTSLERHAGQMLDHADLCSVVAGLVDTTGSRDGTAYTRAATGLLLIARLGC